MGEAKRRKQAVPSYGVTRSGSVVLTPSDDGQLGCTLWDLAPSTGRIRPWKERREQAFAISVGYRALVERLGDVDLGRIADASRMCGTLLTFDQLRCTATDATKKHLRRANFCRGRLCPMCNWRRALKLREQLAGVLDHVLGEHPKYRIIMLGLTERNSFTDDFGAAIERMQKGFGRLLQKRRWRRTILHWFRALEVTCPRPGEYHPHFHVLLIVPAEYFDLGHDLYMDHPAWQRMWREAMRLDYDPVVYINKIDNVHEVAKYVSKPSEYLTKHDDGSWSCDVDRLETLHYALHGRKMVSWSKSLSPLRKALGFLSDDVGDFEDLVQTGEDEDTDGWVVESELTYAWGRDDEGVWNYRLIKIGEPKQRHDVDGLPDDAEPTAVCATVDDW
jgi:plasmid rolling circle replication initiator protein Rep